MGMSKSQEHLIEKRNHQLDQEKPRPLHQANSSVRKSELPVSRHGMNQESDQAKHNRPPKGAPKHEMLSSQE
jgi:hypothetical protein